MPVQTAADLNSRFSILDHVVFEQSENGLVRIMVQTPNATASMLVQGAHLLEWTPAGEQPGLFLSPAAIFQPGKAVRGGVPVIFPWFGAYKGEKKPGVEYMLHGFARISEWTVTRTHFSPDGDVELTLILKPDETSRAVGFDDFLCTLDIEIGKALTMRLTVENKSSAALTFEDGFHTYFAVADSLETTVEGLEGSTYLDKIQDFKPAVQTSKLLHFKRDVDQVHIDSPGDLLLHDNAAHRDIILEKSGSGATVCWNPGTALTPNFKDLEADSWKHFVCVEAVNCMQNSITLKPDESHTLAIVIRHRKQA